MSLFACFFTKENHEEVKPKSCISERDIRKTKTPIYSTFQWYRNKQLPDKLYKLEEITVPREYRLSEATW